MKYTKFKTKHHFIIELTKVLEVANFRFLTLQHITEIRNSLDSYV